MSTDRCPHRLHNVSNQKSVVTKSPACTPKNNSTSLVEYGPTYLLDLPCANPPATSKKLHPSLYSSVAPSVRPIFRCGRGLKRDTLLLCGDWVPSGGSSLTALFLTTLISLLTLYSPFSRGPQPCLVREGCMQRHPSSSPQDMCSTVSPRQTIIHCTAAAAAAAQSLRTQQCTAWMAAQGLRRNRVMSSTSTPCQWDKRAGQNIPRWVAGQPWSCEMLRCRPPQNVKMVGTCNQPACMLFPRFPYGACAGKVNPSARL